MSGNMSTVTLLIGITVVFLIIAIVLSILLIKSMRSIRGQSKNVAQQEDKEKTCVYFPLDLNPSVLIAFKKACTANYTSHTAELERFIVAYCKEHGKGTPEE
jgi:hypothetical protein